MLHEKFGGQMYMIIISLWSTACVTPFLASPKRLNLYLPVRPIPRTTHNHYAMIRVRLEMELPSFWRTLRHVRRSKVSISHDLHLHPFLIPLKHIMHLLLCTVQSIPIQSILFLMMTTKPRLKCFILELFYHIQQHHNVTLLIYILECQPLLWITLQ
jgi:hypothetical protein